MPCNCLVLGTRNLVVCVFGGTWQTLHLNIKISASLPLLSTSPFPPLPLLPSSSPSPPLPLLLSFISPLFLPSPLSFTLAQRNAEDAMSERNDAHFVAKVRDDIINELEVQKQFATAYSIWLEQQHHEGIIRRGIKSIRRSFRRSRGDSASRSREAKTKLQGMCNLVPESTAHVF